MKDAEVWLDEFKNKHPGIFVDLSEEEEEAVCGWLCNVQDDAVLADRSRQRQESQIAFINKLTPEERAALVNTAPSIPPGITHVGGSMLDIKPPKP